MLAANSEGGNVDSLVQMGPGGEGPQTIGIYAQDSHPHWSPSGKAIVFDSDLVGNGRYRIYLMANTEFGHVVGPMHYAAWELLGRTRLSERRADCVQRVRCVGKRQRLWTLCGRHGRRQARECHQLARRYSYGQSRRASARHVQPRWQLGCLFESTQLITPCNA